MTTKTMTDDVIKSAVEAYETALRTGAEIQEQAAAHMKEAMGKMGAPDTWQANMPGIAKDAMETSTKSLEEALDMMSKNAVSSLEQLKQAMDVAQSGSVEDAQAKTKLLWEASLAAMRENTEAVIRANKQTVDAWADAAKQTQSTADQ